MNARAAKITFVLSIAAVIAAMLIFRVRLAFLNAKYLIVLLAIVGLVMLVTRRRR